MKKKYKLLLSVIIAELFIVSILSDNGITIQSWIGNVVGAFIFFLPIQILLFMLGHDEDFTETKRTCFKYAFWFIIICCILGAIASLS